MVVQHNLRAMNANRMLGITQSAQAKSAEKLSSGYKVNRAADDAAGLSISEKMRKQIRGLTQASANAEDGISAVQTAEGALTEVHDMLQRMNELATKAANGTNSESDRQSIQDEIDQLTTEIDRVSETTKFNEIYLLKGNAQGTESEKSVNAHDAGLKGKLTDNGKTAVFELEKALENGDSISIAGREYTIGDKSLSTTSGYDTYANVTSTSVAKGDTVTIYNKTSLEEKTISVVDKVENDAATTFAENGTKFTITDENNNTVEYTIAGTTDLGAGEISASDAEALIAEHLKNADHTVTLTNINDGTNDHAVNLEIVDALGANEYSSYNVASGDETTVNDIVAANTGFAATEVTLNGEKTVITEKDPISSQDVADIIGAMKSGDIFQIVDAADTAGRANPKTITISDKTDAISGKYTKEDALKLINDTVDDMDGIEFSIANSNVDGQKMLAKKGVTNVAHNNGSPTFGGTNAKTVVGSTKDTSDDVITKVDAYAMIAEELQKASSIGADTDAKVTDSGNGKFTIEKGSVTVKDDLNFALHVGADADMTNKIGVKLQSMSTAGLGVKNISIMDDNGALATYAVDAIEDAIKKVSAQRSQLGAVQNRLEHTINNLGNVVENTTAAESQIRDTDIATEMVKFSNSNILAQAGQSMLAQANQANQGALSLLG